MRALRVGERVRVVGSCTCGFAARTAPADVVVHEGVTTTTVASGPVTWDFPGCPCCPSGSVVHYVDVRSPSNPTRQFAARPTWLEPFWDGKESIEWSTELRKLCGLGVKENA